MATEKVDITMYNGELTITYYPVSHQYKVNGDKVISVSAISGVIEKPWMAMRVSNLARDYILGIPENQRTDIEVIRGCNQHREKKAEATYTGTLVHDYVEAVSKGESPELPEDEGARNGILAFLKWKTDHKVQFIMQEKLVYSRQRNYVGRFDAIIEVDGKRYLADYKTSKSFYPMEMGMQTAGYLQAYCEETDENDIGRMILRFDKETGEFDVHILDDYYDDVMAFNAAHTLCKRQKELDAKQKENA